MRQLTIQSEKKPAKRTVREVVRYTDPTDPIKDAEAAEASKRG